jgi:hypothetical protein
LVPELGGCSWQCILFTVKTRDDYLGIDPSQDIFSCLIEPTS